MFGWQFLTINQIRMDASFSVETGGLSLSYCWVQILFLSFGITTVCMKINDLWCVLIMRELLVLNLDDSWV